MSEKTAEDVRLTQYGNYADSDSAKLLLLASWLDKQDDERGFDGPRDVQTDLRRIAHALAHSEGEVSV